MVTGDMELLLLDTPLTLLLIASPESFSNIFASVASVFLGACVVEGEVGLLER